VKTVLLVDESELVRSIVEAVLGARGHAVVGVARLAELVPALERERPDLVLVDLALPGAQRDLKAALARASAAACPIVLFSEGSAIELAKRALTCGAVAYVRKSDDPAILVRHVERLLGVDGS
jgi:DNA-binding NarL/FixJ family response regulator